MLGPGGYGMGHAPVQDFHGPALPFLSRLHGIIYLRDLRAEAAPTEAFAQADLDLVSRYDFKSGSAIQRSPGMWR